LSRHSHAETLPRRRNQTRIHRRTATVARGCFAARKCQRAALQCTAGCPCRMTERDQTLSRAQRLGHSGGRSMVVNFRRAMSTHRKAAQRSDVAACTPSLRYGSNIYGGTGNAVAEEILSYVTKPGRAVWPPCIHYLRRWCVINWEQSLVFEFSSCRPANPAQTQRKPSKHANMQGCVRRKCIAPLSTRSRSLKQ